MIRVLRYAFLASLTILLLVVASANRSLVPLRLLPDDFAALFQLHWQVEMPVFLVLFLGIIIGLLVGFVWEWLREHKHRKVASVKSREVGKLERELATLKDQTALPGDDVLALLDRPKGR